MGSMALSLTFKLILKNHFVDYLDWKKDFCVWNYLWNLGLGKLKEQFKSFVLLNIRYSGQSIICKLKDFICM